MTAAEIRSWRARNESGFCANRDEAALTGAKMLQEIAAQLAELNGKLTPLGIMEAIVEVQAQLEKEKQELERRRKDSGGGPP